MESAGLVDKLQSISDILFMSIVSELYDVKKALNELEALAKELRGSL